ILFIISGCTESILIEAESFDQTGGWLIDPQFVEQMGSPYLIAHGLGEPVKNTSTKLNITKKGTYHIWVRTINWAPGPWEAPGRFSIKIGSIRLPNQLGENSSWNWEYAGKLTLSSGIFTVELIDLTGFDGRCDAIWVSKNKKSPPATGTQLSSWRKKQLNEPDKPPRTESFDLVIIGGGIAGCAAAISAAEQGLNVALVQDRPVLGGNASSEIRIHTEGIYGKFERILRMLDTDPYPNGDPKAVFDDNKRQQNIDSYDNIHQFLNWRAIATQTQKQTIISVDAKHTATGEKIRFTAPLFADCTGDGWIGYWAGAKYFYGRESVGTYDEGWDQYGDTWSPKTADNGVMGASVLWRTYNADKKSAFPEVPWAMDVADGYAASKGTWNWEFISRDLHQIDDGEKIRDHMLMAIFGSFYNQKQILGNEYLKLEWVSYLSGKRESRRLLGDHIYTFNDERENRTFPDSVVVEVRTVDVHYPQQLLNDSKPDFLTEAMYFDAGRYFIPYRSLYSANINNLFMAGRCFSCSHIGLGGPRVMRTTGQMGAAVGLAASLCVKYKSSPRKIYTDHLDEYWQIILDQE
ncbi:MAG: FAD-dependent oxidoreductase, partial [Bacteroidales bacterium]|nr:FAD-dependent oxidoreductase [Bacteroidales bacterium]